MKWIVVTKKKKSDLLFELEYFSQDTAGGTGFQALDVILSFIKRTGAPQTLCFCIVCHHREVEGSMLSCLGLYVLKEKLIFHLLIWENL